MSLVYSPNTCVTTTPCEDELCPRKFANCSNGRQDCHYVEACKPTIIELDLGCNRDTGNKLKTSDLTDVIFTGHHQGEKGQINDFEYSLTNNATLFSVSGAYKYVMTFPGTETTKWPTGRISGKVTFKTATREYVAYDSKICVERATLKPPCVVVSGQLGKPTPFSINQNTVQVWLHDSDIIHSGMTWDRFEIDWGDGTALQTVSINGEALTITNATATHTYAALGDYKATIKGYNTVDAADPCAVTLEDCAVLDCIRINSIA